jgi:hypothetical protein
MIGIAVSYARGPAVESPLKDWPSCLVPFRLSNQI